MASKEAGSEMNLSRFWNGIPSLAFVASVPRARFVEMESDDGR